MAFRFILQPVMAAIAALRDGVNDAKSGRSPYFWTLLTNPFERGQCLYEGLISTARVKRGSPSRPWGTWSDGERPQRRYPPLGARLRAEA
jgi:hypothetical protein